MSQNVAAYVDIKYSTFQITNSIKLLKLIETANPGIRKMLGKRFFSLNSFRVYVNAGTVGIRLGGALATSDASLKIVEKQHFIENCDLSKVSLIGIDGPVDVFIEIANIG